MAGAVSKVVSLRAWKLAKAKKALRKRIYAARLRRLGLTVAEENRRLDAWEKRS